MEDLVQYLIVDSKGSLSMYLKYLTCKQGGPSFEPSLIPCQGFLGMGGLNLNSLVGDSAKGIPEYE